MRVTSTGLMAAFAAVVTLTYFGLHSHQSRTEDPRRAPQASRVVSISDLAASGGSDAYLISSSGGLGFAVPAGRADEPQSVITTTTGRFLVDGIWSGIPGEEVTLHTMLNGAQRLCGAVTPCIPVVSPRS